MAPSPEHDNEPKAPDKTDNKKTESDDLRTGTDFLDDLSASARELDLQGSSVSTLDDGQLKALLDEAINYKTPKDREGKSKIFKVLLQAAEEDERNARAASASGPQLARYYNTSATRRHRRREASASISEHRTHGGSLQNLAQPDLFGDVTTGASVRRPGGASGGGSSGGGNSRRGNKATAPSVSARQREGGSLPSNVNAGLVYDEPTNNNNNKKKDKNKTTATTTTALASCSSDPPKKAEKQQPKDKKMELSESCTSHTKPEYTVIELEANSADAEETRSLLESDHISLNYHSTDNHNYSPQEHHSQPTTDILQEMSSGPLQLPAEYTNVRCCVEPIIQAATVAAISSSSTTTTNSTNTTSSTGQDRQDDNCQITQATLVTNPINTFSSTPYKLVTINPARSLHAVDRFQHLTDKKAIDENGNSVQNLNSAISVLDSKKKKKCKVDRKVTVLNSEEVEGHRADIIESIDLLVKYIEDKDDTKSNNSTSNNNNASSANNRSGKSQQHNTSNTSTSKQVGEGGKKRTRAVKSSKNDVVKKSNSLEEISKSKLEDLVSSEQLVCPRTVRTRVKKQSTSEDGDRRSWGSSAEDQCMRQPETTTIAPAETAEFHVVTKKKKSKKRRSSSGGRNMFNNDSETHRVHQPYGRGEEAVCGGGVGGRRRGAGPMSVPPSDKSNDSSDADSVHSLPCAPTPTTTPTTLTSYAAAAGNTNITSSASSSHAATTPHSLQKVQPPVKNHILLKSEHFPELEIPVGDVVTRPDDFPSLERSRNHSTGPISVPTTTPQKVIKTQISNCDNNKTVLQTIKQSSSVSIINKSPVFNQVQSGAGDNRSCGLVAIATPNSGNVLNSGNNVVYSGQNQNTVIIGQNIGQNSASSSISGPNTVQNIGQNTQNAGLSSQSVEHSGQNSGKHADGSQNSGQISQNRQNSGQNSGHSYTRRISNRPAVIILNENGPIINSSNDPIQVSGLTFGFELNEQLLNNCSDDVSTATNSNNSLVSPTNSTNSLVSPPSETGSKCSAVNTVNSVLVRENFNVRYLEPPLTVAATATATNATSTPLHLTYNHDKIVTYVGLAWEDIVHQANGKVQYYSGQ